MRCFKVSALNPWMGGHCVFQKVSATIYKYHYSFPDFWPSTGKWPKSKPYTQKKRKNVLLQRLRWRHGGRGTFKYFFTHFVLDLVGIFEIIINMWILSRFPLEFVLLFLCSWFWTTLALFLVRRGTFCCKDWCPEKRVRCFKSWSNYFCCASSVSIDAIKLALKNNIDIVFLSGWGKPLGRVFPCKLGGTTPQEKSN